MTSLVVNNCELFLLCGYRHELVDTESDSDTSPEKENAFHEAWILLGTERDASFSSYVIVDNELVAAFLHY